MRQAQAAVPAAANIKDICSSTSPLLTFYLLVALYVNQITTSHATRFSCSACDIIANAKQLRTRRKRYVSLRFHVIVPQKHRQYEQLLRIMISISLVLSASENNVSISWEFFKFAAQLDALLIVSVSGYNTLKESDARINCSDKLYLYGYAIHFYIYMCYRVVQLSHNCIDLKWRLADNIRTIISIVSTSIEVCCSSIADIVSLLIVYDKLNVFVW